MNPLSLVGSGVIQLPTAQFEVATDILCQAFAQDPVTQYLTPERASDRQALLHCLYSTVLRYGQAYQHIYTTADGMKGIAIWTPPEQQSFNLWRFAQLGGYKLPWLIGWQRLGRWRAVFEVDSYRQADMPQPHWYLMMLGVAPAYQGQGVGRRLLQPVLEQADRTGTLCYLETSTEGGVRFYQRLGFEIVRSGQLSANAPQFWTMRRNPQPVIPPAS